MKIVVFTEDNALGDLFKNALFDSEKVNVIIHSLNNLDKDISAPSNESYHYIDLTELKQKQINNLIKKTQSEKLNLAFIDPKGKIKDPADIIFKGIFDYLGKDLIKKIKQSKTVDISRIEAAIKFRSRQLTIAELRAEDEKLKREFGFCSSWKEVEEGKEYLFWILYIGVENFDSLKESMSNEYRKYLFARFKEFVRRIVRSGNGRIWIWNENGGVVLFPYDGRSIDAVASSFRLILNRRIFNYELKDSFDLYYRIALHKGRTVYRERGKTGTIISDDINKVFHLGLDFANGPGFYITNTAMELLPQRAIKAFRDLGIYEGLRIYKFYNFV